MTMHSSATVREEASRETKTQHASEPHGNQTTMTATIIDALKRRAQAVVSDTSIDAQSRAVIRYALETNDPWLAELVRRAEAGECIRDAIDESRIDFSQGPATDVEL